MPVNVKATYHSEPRETIGPFVATLEYFESSGITVSGISVTGVTLTSFDDGNSQTGSIETLNIGPVYTILKDDLTHQQLVDGYTFKQIKCGDTYITFQSTDVCFNSYRTDLVGSNGYPTVRLTVNNDDAGKTVTSTLTVTPIGNVKSPVPSTITVTNSIVGSEYGEISLGKGVYNFSFDISTDTPHNDLNRNAVLTFIDCGPL